MELVLALEGASHSDPVELDQLTGQLRRRLLELDVDDVRAVRTDEIPPGAKPVDPVTLGALIVTAGPAVVKAVGDLVGRWMENRPIQTVKLTIGEESLELSSASPEERERLVDLFVARNAGT